MAENKPASHETKSNAVHTVTSNQDGLYKHLDETVRKYMATRFLRPIAEHTREAFEKARVFVEKIKGPNEISAPASVILDSGCGTGESTLHLAKRFPGIPVIGIDKSAMRLTKAGNERQLEKVPGTTANDQVPQNAFWVRAELLDFWRLALEEVKAGRWQVLHHAVFYPNPWPKESEAGRRFHLHPIFPTLMALSPVTELRTNWEIYAREFAAAAEIACKMSDATKSVAICCEAFNPEIPETAFERKYKEAGQKLWKVFVKK